VNSTPTQNSFDKLLALLDADREQAGSKYENLRQRLIRFFEWRNCEMPEELTDIVFDRILRKIEEGEEIQQLTAYASTISQFVFKEYLRSNEKQNQLIEESPEVQNIKQEIYEENETETLRLNCFEKCLAEFDRENRKFIIAYYTTDEKTLIAARKRLADELNSNLNTIRIKACRLKSKLENCTLKCCKEKAVAESSSRKQ
jgi:DNA-directed RNA polymerase specialized sigma24 family protein